jgi:hypothetical protein
LLLSSAAASSLLEDALSAARQTLADAGLVVSGSTQRRSHSYQRFGEDGVVVLLEAEVREGCGAAEGLVPVTPLLLLRCGVVMESAPRGRDASLALLLWGCHPQDVGQAWYPGAEPALGGLRLTGTVCPRAALDYREGMDRAIATLRQGLEHFGNTLDVLADEFSWRLLDGIAP